MAQKRKRKTNRKLKMTLLIIIVLLFAIGCGAGTYYYFFGNGKDSKISDTLKNVKKMVDRGNTENGKKAEAKEEDKDKNGTEPSEDNKQENDKPANNDNPSDPDLSGKGGKTGDDNKKENPSENNENDPNKEPDDQKKDPDNGNDPKPDEPAKPEEPKKAAWTVLVYMCGADLDKDVPYASRVIANMCESEIADNINVIVETGGSKEWNNADYRFKGNPVQKINIPVYSLGRFKISNGSVTTLKSANAASMGDSKTLSDFIAWGSREYPAEKYMLVMWNHGLVEPYGCLEMDDIYYTDSKGNLYNSLTDSDLINTKSRQGELFYYDYLDLDELTSGLSGGGVNFEMIAFNTCLSSSLEIAAAVAPYGKYMIASQESIPAVIGLPEKAYLGCISENPGCDGSDVGRVICEYYKEAIAEYDGVANDGLFARSTMSLIKLSGMEEIKKNFVELWKNIYYSCYDVSSFKDIQQAAAMSETFGAEGMYAGNLIDIGDFLEKASSLFADTSFDENLRALIRKNVTAVQGSSRNNVTGLSFFFPNVSYVEQMINQYGAGFSSYDQSVMKQYYKRIFAQYLDPYIRNIDYIDGYYWFAAYLDVRMEDYWSAPNECWQKVKSNIDREFSDQDTVSSDDVSVQLKTELNAKNRLQMTVTKGRESIVQVDMHVKAGFETGGEYLILDLGETGDVFCDWNKGVFEDSFEAKWYQIGGKLVNVFPIEENADYYVYGIPAVLNGEDVTLYVEHNYVADDYVIHYACKPNENDGVASRDFITLTDGDVLNFKYTVMRKGKESYEIISDPITYSADTEMKMESLLAEDTCTDFYLYFVVYDVFGNKYESDALSLPYEGIRLTNIGF